LPSNLHIGRAFTPLTPRPQSPRYHAERRRFLLLVQIAIEKPSRLRHVVLLPLVSRNGSKTLFFADSHVKAIARKTSFAFKNACPQAFYDFEKGVVISILQHLAEFVIALDFFDFTSRFSVKALVKR
jgi:hypothetical protein